MKKLLLVIVVLLVVAGVGGAVFLATFDANRYRPMVVQKLEAATGRPVQLDHIALGWHGGGALQLKGLAIYPAGAAASGEPIAQVEAVNALVRLAPLLHKEVQVSSIVVTRPRVRISRDAQGHIDLVGAAAVGSPAAAGSATPSTGQGGSPVALSVDAFRVEDGWVRWTDAMTNPPTDVTVKRVNVLVRDVSLVGPMTFEARAAAFSDEPDIEVSGRVHAPAGGRPAVVEDVHAAVDLSKLNLDDMARALPAVAKAELAPGLAGHLDVRVERAVLDPAHLNDIAATVDFTDGRIALQRLASPIDQLQLHAKGGTERVELSKLAARVGGGAINVSGVVEHLSNQPHTTLQATAQNVSLDALLPPASTDQPHLRGQATGTFEGSAVGLAWPEMSRTLTGQARMSVTDGRIENLNILRMIFERMSILPGLVQTLEARLPQSYQAKLQARDTVFRTVELPVTFNNGSIVFSHLLIASDTFELTGEGNMGFNGTMDARSMVRVDAELTRAMIASVKELQNLTDQSGRLEIPVTLRGNLPRVVPTPDLQYIASRLISTKAQDLIGGLIERSAGKEQGGRPATPGQPNQPATTPSEPQASPLGTLLRGVLEQQGVLPSQSPTPQAPRESTR